MRNRKISPEAMMAKAEAANATARLLLKHGDLDGAANRAYYAMFDAARAALLLSGAPIDLKTVRTHNGLIGAFGNFLVKNGTVSNDLGRFINKAYQVRLMADYDGDFVESDDARRIVEQAETFVAAIRAQFMPDTDDDDEDDRPGP